MVLCVGVRHGSFSRYGLDGLQRKLSADPGLHRTSGIKLAVLKFDPPRWVGTASSNNIKAVTGAARMFWKSLGLLLISRYSGQRLSPKSTVAWGQVA